MIQKIKVVCVKTILLMTKSKYQTTFLSAETEFRISCKYLVEQPF